MKYTEENEPYLKELEKLQIELVQMQRWVQETNARVVILFEGRDTAGKGGAIFHFTRFLNPRAMRTVALPKPSDDERGQWYFQRYIKHLPNPGEIIFFDRSWYNRAVVEPVMGFCTEEQYQKFMKQVLLFEQMLIEDGILFFKFWFSIDISEQQRRLEDRKVNPLKQWKLSTVDMLAQQKWDDFTHYKEKMFEGTHTDIAPWIIIKGNHKPSARMEAIRFILSQVSYDNKGKSRVSFKVDDSIVGRYQ